MGSGRKEKKEKSGKLVSLAALFICFEQTVLVRGFKLDLYSSEKPVLLASFTYPTPTPLTPPFPQET